MSLKDSASAVEQLRRVARQKPLDAVAHYDLADAEFRAGDIRASIESFRRVIELDPRNHVAHRNLGVLLERVADREEAAACYRAALALDDTDAIAHFNLGNVLNQKGRSGEALASFQRAVELQPRFAGAWCNCATVLLATKRYSEALECSERALALHANAAQAWYLHAAALWELKRAEDALRSCRRALALQPDHAGAHYVLANLLGDSGDRQGALAEFHEVLRLDPSIDEARLAAVIAEIPIIPLTTEETTESRRKFAIALKSLDEELQRRPPEDPAVLVGAVQPFYLAYQEEDHREVLGVHGRLCARAMGAWQRDEQLVMRTDSPSRGVTQARVAEGGSRIRIGFVSAHIKNHPVYAAIMRGWLHHLDRQRFAVELFHLGTRTDAETAAARTLADHFEDEPRTVRDWARAILDRRIDILIYPEIGMDHLTLQLASMRLAPAQLAAWGHPITSGLPTLDYYLSAEAFEPSDGASHYTEQLVRLPHLGAFYEPATGGQALGPGDTGADSSETGAPVADAAQAVQPTPSTGPVFICAGTPFKYAPEHDTVLVDIARRLGRCQFQFFAYRNGALTRRLLDRLKRVFAAHGLDAAAYLLLRPWTAAPEFSEALRSADLMLDTIGFSGFNTVMQALACGLPVVTCRGRFMRGRLGSGILEQLSLGELVGDSPARYVDIAVSLAERPSARMRLRGEIRERLPRVYRDREVIGALEKFLLTVA